MTEEMRSTPDIERLLARGAECGCVEESAIDRLAESLELDANEVEDLRDRLSRRGIDVDDDCGMPGVPPTRYADSDLVQHTIDTMGQFLREAARFPLLTYSHDVQSACEGADIVLHLTEWAQFRELDPVVLGDVVAHRRILDGRGVLDAVRWRAAGWTYRALGRP